MSDKRIINAAGFSIIELLIVLVIFAVMISVMGYYFLSHQKMYKPDDQSLKFVDVLHEARQRSLTQRETMRVEVDLTDNIIRLIDENTPLTADDDREIRKVPILPQTEVKISSRPSNILVNPPEPLPAPNAVFTPSVYPLSATHNVCTIRFQSNGTVVNAGTNATGNGSTITGLTLHIWSPKKNTPSETDIARSITIIGSTGSIRLWEWDFQSTDANKWQDSRRASAFGS